MNYRNIISANNIDMSNKSRNQLIRRLLSKITDQELSDLVNTRENQRKLSIAKPIPTPRTKVNTQNRKRLIPATRKSVKKMGQEYENNIISPSVEFRDKPIPTPRTKKYNLFHYKELT